MHSDNVVADPHVAAPAIIDLPNAILDTVIDLLDDYNAARLSSTCKRLHVMCKDTWERRVRRKWKHWEPSRWTSTKLRNPNWNLVYSQRVQGDARVNKTLEELWSAGDRPSTSRAAAIQVIRDLGLDSLDFLLTACQSDDMDTSKWAAMCLTQVAVPRCKEMLLNLVKRSFSPAEVLEQAAIALSTLMYPQLQPQQMLDLFAALAAEARHRIEAAGAAGDLRQTLQAIIQLLFGPAPPTSPTPNPLSPSASSSQPPPLQQQQQQQQQRQRHQGRAPSGRGGVSRLAAPSFRAFCCMDEQVTLPGVPPASFGLGLQGAVVSYYRTENSILPFVLQQRQGIPMSLSLIFLVVARRVGVPVRLVNLPAHIVAGAGELGTPDEVFVDCFNRGRLHDRNGIRGMLEEMHVPLRDSVFEPATSAPMLLVLRMINNLLHGLQRNDGLDKLQLDLLLAALLDVSIPLVLALQQREEQGGFCSNMLAVMYQQRLYTALRLGEHELVDRTKQAMDGLRPWASQGV